LILRFRRDRDPIIRDRLIAATVVAMPLLMPFYFDYDLLLLSAAAVLVAREPSEKPITATWIVLALWLVVNSSVARWTHVNGTVIVLATLTTMLIARALRREAQT